jgi:hypothetical protein
MGLKDVIQRMTFSDNPVIKFEDFPFRSPYTGKTHYPCGLNKKQYPTFDLSGSPNMVTMDGTLTNLYRDLVIQKQTEISNISCDYSNLNEPKAQQMVTEMERRLRDRTLNTQSPFF